MIKLTKILLTSTLIVTASAAQAEVAANIAVVSDYLFRGVTQTDGPAVQGGLDYASDSGLYLGTWMSNVDFGGKEESEVDLYAGFAGDAGVIGYDLGAFYFWYPGAGDDDEGGDLDYSEIALNISYKIFTAGIAYTIWGETDNAPFDTGDIYYSASVDIPVNDVFSLAVFVGHYEFKEKADVSDTAIPDFQDVSYNHFGVSLTKDVGEFGMFNINLEKNDIDGDDGAQAWLGLSKDF